ncbi:hypothetical protein [Heyndrickxia acidicola]|uniref:Uncharacterized protein n=1 Tax=Heyndrickxia acidicola TaxID=209389 RepID=A0ABU6MRY3_9BACI|nr:hypothetical protein [Heyndrickxia acidicola]MED1205967.1 hypothetical protein [Heyndrickxia acidicola]
MNQHIFKELSSKMNQIKWKHTQEKIKVLIDKDYIQSERELFPYRLSKEEINHIRNGK